MPDAVLIAGANGAGKTTLARRLLPAAYPDARFLNADEIQREEGFSSPSAAGRELISRLKTVSEAGDSFVVETTLSSASYGRQFAAWRGRGYWVTVHYIEAVSADFAVARVARRVAAGGHGIPELDIRRRYARGRVLFAELYRPQADAWYHYKVDERGLELVESNQDAR